MTKYINPSQIWDTYTGELKIMSDDLSETLSLQAPASYIIYKDGNVIKAKNGETGVVEFSGDDAATVIQDAVNALKGVGGKILIKRGVYRISNTILLYPSITLEGETFGWLESPATELYAGGDLNSAVIKMVYDTEHSASVFPVIKNIFIRGTKDSTKPNQHGVEISDEYGRINDIVMFNVMITEMSGHALYMHSYDGKLYMLQCYFENSLGDGIRIGVEGETLAGHVLIEQSYIFGNSGYGINIYPSLNVVVVNSYIFNCGSGGISLGSWATLRIFSSSIRNSGGYGIELKGAGRLIAIGNEFYNNRGDVIGNYTGSPELYITFIGNNLRVGYSTTTPVKGIHIKGTNKGVEILGNIFQENKDGSVDYYIYLEGSISKAIIEGNLFLDDAVSENIYNGASGEIKIKNNIGYVTENSGTATISAGSTSVTVSHGLASTPSKVLVTPIGDPGDRYWVANITSTSFDIVVATAPAADITFHWEASV